MTREKFFAGLMSIMADVPDFELTRETIRRINFDFHELYARALEDAPCAHNSQQNYIVTVNGQRIERCGICCRDMGVVNG